jgi:hypothetical protein
VSEHRMLYDMIVTKTEEFYLLINSGGELGVEECGNITIVFVNDKFSHVNFATPETPSRNGWRILAAINSEIEKIEAERGCK